MSCLLLRVNFKDRQITKALLVAITAWPPYSGQVPVNVNSPLRTLLMLCLCWLLFGCVCGMFDIWKVYVCYVYNNDSYRWSRPGSSPQPACGAQAQIVQHSVKLQRPMVAYEVMCVSSFMIYMRVICVCVYIYIYI